MELDCLFAGETGGLLLLLFDCGEDTPPLFVIGKTPLFVENW